MKILLSIIAVTFTLGLFSSASFADRDCVKYSGQGVCVQYNQSDEDAL